MKHHEREFFIATIRTGNIKLLNLVIKPLTIEQSVEAAKVYGDFFDTSLYEGVMTEDQMIKWMIQQGLWHRADDNELDKIDRAIEDVKVEMFKNYTDKDKVKTLRVVLGALIKKKIEKISYKNSYFSNTCEGIAALEKTSWIIKNSTFLEDELYDFEEHDVTSVINSWQQTNMSDSQIRELARNEPWRSLWSMRESAGIKLFINKDFQELTSNQKNLIVWSQLYDNIRESMDVPPDQVIGDDDMLDGWFIEQGRKRKREVKKKHLEDSLTNKDIANKDEVFIMSRKDDTSNIQDVYDMNEPTSRWVVNERDKQIKSEGKVAHHKLSDQKIMQQQQVNENIKHRG
jgi:hypothetical protein